MKIFSAIIFSSLLAFIFNANPCVPDHGVDYLSDCSYLSVWEGDLCCMVTYTDYENEVYHVCYEITAHMIYHFEDYDSRMKDVIESYYPGAPSIDTIDYFYCSSKFVKLSFFALLLILL